MFVGLGNPGRRYEGTRHNVGFDAVDEILKSVGGRFEMHGRDAALAEVTIEGKPIALLKPLSYMNRSGDVVAEYVESTGLAVEELIVIYDDFALPLGKLRLRERGSDGGHNGLASVLEALETTEIARMRVGIAPEEPPQDWVEFVLSPFTDEERPVVDASLERVVEASRMLMTEGVSRTMSRFNAGGVPAPRVSEDEE